MRTSPIFFERKKEKSEKLPNGKSDHETCRDSNRESGRKEGKREELP